MPNARLANNSGGYPQRQLHRAILSRWLLGLSSQFFPRLFLWRILNARVDADPLSVRSGLQFGATNQTLRYRAPHHQLEQVTESVTVADATIPGLGEARVKSLPAHAVRSLIIARKKLVGQRFTLDNQIRAPAVVFGVRLPRALRHPKAPMSLKPSRRPSTH